MLAKMTEELETGLTYDHIGIAVLEYSTRELVIQAEAGKRRGALGQRIPLGAGLVGNVARNGNMASFHSAQAGDAALKPMMADTSSAIGLPIFFAEQLHGVLYVESAEPVDFTEEEILLLGTLADLISGALHNALTFQKAQEQAITDGLRSEEHTSELQSHHDLVCRLLLEKKKPHKYVAENRLASRDPLVHADNPILELRLALLHAIEDLELTSMVFGQRAKQRVRLTTILV